MVNYRLYHCKMPFFVPFTVTRSFNVIIVIFWIYVFLVYLCPFKNY